MSEIVGRHVCLTNSLPKPSGYKPLSFLTYIHKSELKPKEGSNK